MIKGALIFGDGYVFQFDIKPEPWQRVRCNTSTGAFFTPHSMRAFKNLISVEMRKKMRTEKWEMKNGPLLMAMHFHFKEPKKTKLISPKGDLDNFCKSIMDSGNGIIYRDDAQIVTIYASKRWSDNNKIIVVVDDYKTGEEK